VLPTVLREKISLFEGKISLRVGKMKIVLWEFGARVVYVAVNVRV